MARWWRRSEARTVLASCRARYAGRRRCLRADTSLRFVSPLLTLYSLSNSHLKWPWNRSMPSARRFHWRAFSAAGTADAVWMRPEDPSMDFMAGVCGFWEVVRREE